MSQTMINFRNEFPLMNQKKTKSKPKKKADNSLFKPSPKTDDSKPFDFGGLPDRDLKKNLGCG